MNKAVRKVVDICEVRLEYIRTPPISDEEKGIICTRLIYELFLKPKTQLLLEENIATSR
jgi:hypothetical protein